MKVLALVLLLSAMLKMMNWISFVVLMGSTLFWNTSSISPMIFSSSSNVFRYLSSVNRSRSNFCEISF